MKNLITILILLVAVGCGSQDRKLTEEEKKIVGTYEAKEFEETFKLVLLENGKFKAWTDGEKDGEGTWKIVGKEVHVIFVVNTSVLKIESNGDLTLIAAIIDGKRTDFGLLTFKKLK